MKNIFPIFYKTLFSVVIIAFILSFSIYIILQTPWGKNKILSSLQNFAKNQKIELSIKEIHGLFPLSCKLSNISASISEDVSISIDSVIIKIAPLSFLQKKLILSNCEISNVTINTHKSYSILKDTSKEIPKWISTPYGIDIRKFYIENLYLPFRDLKVDIFGKFKIAKKAKKILLEISLMKQEFPKSLIKFSANGNKKDHIIKTNTLFSIADMGFFYPFIEYNKNCDFHINIETSAKFETYLETLLSTHISPPSSIEFNVYGDIHSILNDPFLEKIEKDWKIESKGHLFSDLSLYCDQLELNNPYLSIEGNFHFKDLFTIDNVDLSLTCKDLSEIRSLPLSGSIYAQANIFQKQNQPNIHIEYKIKDLSYNDIPFQFFSGKIDSKLIDKDFIGDFKINTSALDTPIDIKSNFQFSNLNKPVNFDDLEIKTILSETKADLSILPSHNIVGSISSNIMNVSRLSIFFPEFKAQAELLCNIELYQKDNDPSQYAKVNIDVNNGIYSILKIDRANLFADIKNPFSNPVVDVFISANNSSIHDLIIQETALSTSNREANWPLELDIVGTWKDPFELSLNAFWNLSKESLFFNIQDMHGHMLSHSFITPKPMQLQWDFNKSFNLTDFDVELATSSFSANIQIGKDMADVRLLLDHFPIDFLSFNPLELDISGFSSIDAILSKKDENIEGHINILLEEMDVIALGDKIPLTANGSLQSQLINNRLTLSSKLQIRESELLEIKGDIPLKLNFFPNEIKIPPHDPLNAEIVFDGRIEELLDFINIGSHKLEGEVKSQLKISNTFASPNVEGFCDLKNGIYENYFTGTYLRDLQSQMTADKNDLIIHSLTADDTTKGSITAKGQVEINPLKHFPFVIEAKFSDLTCVHSDLMKAEARGHIIIEGDFKGAKTQGKIEITDAIISIPDKLPVSIPTLPIAFINPQEQHKKITTPITPSFYPLHLDMTIYANDQVYIRGRGLDSEWKGDFNIGGTFTDLAVKGNLDLIHGSYLFSGREFILTQGSVTFSGLQRTLPSLSITAKTVQQGTAILARLNGPINSPAITFSSIPPLPESAIMSLLIFGQDISEISGPQAVQLAAAISSLTDNANVLESTKKGLGIDRLAIVSHRGASSVDDEAAEDYDHTSLQVGKYVTRGVIVSLSQGSEQGSSNVIVEVDLKHGFIFQAETDQMRGQAKFSLKWNLNY